MLLRYDGLKNRGVSHKKALSFIIGTWLLLLAFPPWPWSSHELPACPFSFSSSLGYMSLSDSGTWTQPQWTVDINFSFIYFVVQTPQDLVIRIPSFSSCDLWHTIVRYLLACFCFSSIFLLSGTKGNLEAFVYIFSIPTSLRNHVFLEARFGTVVVSTTGIPLLLCHFQLKSLAILSYAL